MKKKRFEKIVISILAAMLLLSILFLIFILTNKSGKGEPEQPIEQEEEEVLPDDIVKINLSEQTETLTLAGGKYELTGKTNFQILISGEEKTELYFNNASITTSGISAIKNDSSAQLLIHSVANTENALRTTGAEVDSIIESNGDITLSGTGYIEVTTTNDATNCMRIGGTLRRIGALRDYYNCADTITSAYEK